MNLAVWRHTTTHALGRWGWLAGWRQRGSTGTPISQLLNGLTDFDDIHHGNRYFDDDYFGTKFKAFRDLWTECYVVMGGCVIDI